MNKVLSKYLFFTLSVFGFYFINAQHSVARKWNEVLLEGIRNDFARPTVHARNLFHTSTLMYDSWAVFEENASTYFLGKDINGYSVSFTGISDPADKKKAVETTLSYACHRLITYRFRNSPGSTYLTNLADSLLLALGYDKNFIDEEYSTGNYAALGNYMANQMIAYGLQDGSNEQNDYANTFYTSKNKGLLPTKDGNPDIQFVNNWQPLIFDVFIDQSGNEIVGAAPPFLSPEWGNVDPFSLEDSDLTIKNRDGNAYKVYLDPGAPPHLDSTGISDDYKWNFLLVSMWSSHLHPSDSVKIDISPAAQGNLQIDLDTVSDIRTLYKDSAGGDISEGYSLNPITGNPYTPQIVNRGDFGRVLAEFWADGPKSETPPGHWFTILNYVSDHPLCIKKYKGEGQVLDDLEWDVKAYFELGGAMHDCAVSAWGIKGYYDYIRPISALRYMCDQGQSSDTSLMSYSPHGIPLVDGFSELVLPGDPLAGAGNTNVGKIKLRAWKGPRYISNPVNDDAGVGWILGEDWWPYQRPTFVTPPFAGYVSGHSTFSRAAADVLTHLTGSPYFPGGLGEFEAKKNEFLVFEEGPSQDIVLQWASYVDASNQTSLSRIWGGIHPPADDIPGRIIGEKIAIKATEKAEKYFDGTLTSTFDFKTQEAVFPNPMKSKSLVTISLPNEETIELVEFVSLDGRSTQTTNYKQINNELYFNTPFLASGTYVIRIQSNSKLYAYLVVVNE